MSVQICHVLLQAEFEEVETTETPVLNAMNRCSSTPRHPCLVAVDLLRRAFLCLHTVQQDDLAGDATRHAASEGTGTTKRVRFSRTATGISVAPSEEGSPEHVSPLAGGRRARRSTTLASLSVSPSRSIGTRSPISISPERSRKQEGRSSDPNVLTSSSTGHLSPSRCWAAFATFCSLVLRWLVVFLAAAELLAASCHRQARESSQANHRRQ